MFDHGANQKIIALVDCNAFYCSCEQIFRPDLKNQPVVVLSNNDGCAISRTTEAKALGIKMGEPFFKFKHLLKNHQLHIFSSNFSLYTNISSRVMNTLKRLAPDIEMYSIDEAFLDLTGVKDPFAFGMMVKDIIWQEVGIPVGVGIGRTKVLAKIANRIAKKSHKAKGVVEILQPHYLECALKQVAIEDVWGIGRANAEKMRALGIKNSWQLREYKNEQTILKIFTKVGLQIKHELQEISCFPFNKPYEPKKEIMCSRTFGGTVTTIADLKQAVASYVSLAAEKLRSQNSVCQEISVFARTNPFNGSEQTYLFETKKLPTPTADTFKLIDYAFAMLEKNFSAGYAYKKAGVRLLDFYQSREYQLDFFAHHDTEKSLLLMHALDKINYREGEQTLQSAACGVSQIAFKMNRNYKSPRYTTSWNELLVIKN